VGVHRKACTYTGQHNTETTKTKVCVASGIPTHGLDRAATRFESHQAHGSLYVPPPPVTVSERCKKWSHVTNLSSLWVPFVRVLAYSFAATSFHYQKFDWLQCQAGRDVTRRPTSIRQVHGSNPRHTDLTRIVCYAFHFFPHSSLAKRGSALKQAPTKCDILSNSPQQRYVSMSLPSVPYYPRR
jgi:hypothetical protein